MDIEDVMKRLRAIAGPNTCWGVRRLEDGRLEAFYHPWGCETEIRWRTGEGFVPFLAQIKREKDTSERYRGHAFGTMLGRR